jgi:hypothetical protein
VDLIARMLLDTDLPVSHIAGALGCDNLQHIARYFRREKTSAWRLSAQNFVPKEKKAGHHSGLSMRTGR